VKNRNAELQLRLQKFACDCLKISEIIPSTVGGRHVAGQLVRSGTSPALHYGEALAAESRRDFVHKMKVCLKELHEAKSTLILVEMMQWILYAKLNSVIKEADELISIFTASIKTAIRNSQQDLSGQ
jgi:four helix bundle protein